MKQLAKAQTRAWKFIALFFVMLLGQIANAQQSLLTIRAKTKSVDIKDGTIFQKNIWSLSPEAKPDTYYVIEPEKEKKVTFYTDIDSISFDVKPGLAYDFIILLNGNDTCYTQISSVLKDSFKEKIEVINIDPALLQSDFTLLKEALQREHAGLYRYKNENKFTQLSDSLFQALNHSMNQFEFGALIRFFLSSIEDGHTGSNLPSELMQYYSEHIKMFPIQLYFVDKRSFVLCSEFNELPPETELLSIDGKSINDIRKVLFRYLSSDGTIETKKYWTLNSEAFQFLYSWVFGEKSNYTIAYRNAAGEIKSIDLKADFIKESCAPNGHGNNNNYLQLEHKPNNIAILTIRTFSSERLRQTNEDFITFLQSTFTEIKSKKVDKLIIDLRDNGGGDDEYGALLYSYLTDKSFRYFASIESTTRKFEVKDHRNLAVQNPSVNNFKKEVVFVINGLCFSTTADFCAIAKSDKRGKFVGEETGGAYNGNTSGETFKMSLPNSNINIAIPKNMYKNAVRKAKHHDRGVIPDYIIIPTISDKIQNKDVQLDYTLEL
jgi:Peptidase family S41